MSAIYKIRAIQVLDSRGYPTIQAEVWTESGAYGVALVPSGASTGSREALELRDGTKAFGGKSVLEAVNAVNKKIAPLLKGIEITEQRKIDEKMISADGSENKKNLGANAILSVSLAVARAAADELELPLYKYLGGANAHKLPVPMFNIINGGAHADNNLDFQEFMIMPIGAKTFSEAIQMASETFHSLKSILKEKGLTTAVGDEGGFAPDLTSPEDAIELINKAIVKAGYKPRKDIVIAMDCAASEFFDQKSRMYILGAKRAANAKTRKEYTSEQLVAYFVSLTEKYPIVSIEDPFDEADKAGFKLLTAKIGGKVQIVGDDLLVTNPKLIKEAINDKLVNSVLIKVNQIGTLTETIEAIQTCQKAGWTAIISHRSGETEDTTIADLAVAFNTGQIKTGSMSRTDRIAKYNRLLTINANLGKAATFLPEDIFYNLKK